MTHPTLCGHSAMVLHFTCTSTEDISVCVSTCPNTTVSINEILIPVCSTYQSSDIKMTTNTFPATHYNNNNKLGNMSLKANII